MKRPERQFWTYIAVLSSVLLIGLSGQLISCARADTVQSPTKSRSGRIHPVEQPHAPWNQTGPSVTSQPAVRVEAQLDRSSVLFNSSGTVRVEVRMDTLDDVPHAARSQSDIVVVVDTSGSMAGEKLHFAKQALFELFERLGDEDRFALVEYNTSAQTLIPLQFATAYAKDSFRRVTAELVAVGSTNMSAGIDRGASMLNYDRASASRVGRMVLLSDGLANAGDATASGLSERAQRLSRQGFALTTMGIGQDFDEQLMTRLATSGTGAFYYLAKLAYLPEFLEAELASNRETYARSAELHFTAASQVQLVDAMGLDIEYRGGTQVLRLGNLYAGRNRSVWLTLRVPTYQLGSLPLGRMELSYERDGYAERVTVGHLPEVVCLNDRLQYERNVKKEVWERALLNNVFTQAEEDFGDAIRSGDRRVIEQALASAEQERQLAQSLGSDKVLGRIDALKGQAAQAAEAQSAAPAVRNEEAKKAKARGYQQRNSASYKSLDSAMGAY